MKKRIIYNLNDFAREMVDFITNETKDGKSRLIDVFQVVSERYNEPLNSVVKSVLYSWTRTRTDDLKKIQQELEDFPDPITRAQDFLKFISKGEWTSTSANTDVFWELIQAVIKDSNRNNQEGYASEQNRQTLLYSTIPALRELIERDIKKLLADSEGVRKEKERREAETKILLSKKSEALPSIEIKSSFFEAISAAKNPAKQIFYFEQDIMSSQNNKNSPFEWQLYYCDLLGKAHRMPLSAEIKKQLEKKNPAIAILKLPVEQLNAMKQACSQVRKQAFDTTHVEVIETGRNVSAKFSTFIVSLNNPLPSIVYFDAFGNQMPLALDTYPELNQWLQSIKSVEFMDLTLLKACLRSFDVSKKVDNISQVAVGKFFQKEHGITLLAVNSLDSTDLKPWQRREGTYFLTKKNDGWVLYQRVKGKETLLDTRDWDEFNNRLSLVGNMSPVDLAKSANFHLLRQSIQKTSGLVTSMRINCKALDNFDESIISADIKPDSFVITKKHNRWQVFYLDTLSHVLRVNWPTINGLADIFHSLNEKPSALSQEQLTLISSLLKENKPSRRQQLDTDVVKKLEACLTNRQDSPVVDSVSLSPSKPTRLSDNRYSALQSIFGGTALNKTITTSDNSLTTPVNRVC